MIAWGGTTPDDEETGLGNRGVNRVWFYDLSAGPEAWGGSYDITNADLDGDGEPDYRIPPAWEYAPTGYRAPSALTGDLAKVARYAAINLLFTSSPLYPPYLTPELLPSAIDVGSTPSRAGRTSMPRSATRSPTSSSARSASSSPR